MSVFDFIIRFKSDGVDQMVNTVSGKLSRAVNSLGSSMAGYVSDQAIKARVESTVRYALSIKDLSEQTGISTKKLQEWEYAAGLTGMTIQDLIVPYNRLKLAREAAMTGKPGNQNAQDFAALGISTSQLKGMSPEDTFQAVGMALSKVSGGADVARISVNMFGRDGIRVANALKNGLLESAANAENLGIILGEGLIEQMDIAEKKMALFQKRITLGFANVIGAVMKGWDMVNARARGLMQAGFAAYYNQTRPEGGALDKDGHQYKLGRTSISDAYDEGFQTAENEQTDLEQALARESAHKKSMARKASGLQTPDAETPKSASSSGGGGGNQADALARIGLFRGGSGPSQTALLQTQITHLSRIVQKLDTLNGNLTTDTE